MDKLHPLGSRASIREAHIKRGLTSGELIERRAPRRTVQTTQIRLARVRPSGKNYRGLSGVAGRREPITLTKPQGQGRISH